ncbi:50S ribosomal protein L10 [Geothrix edaphica]|jgi:large subunit ribosomal protein L10|uniref:Large ribosomal subunit protein uL10 n=1 Tax=Geothrix edaphica TaxID=2927976 RepID=A0ABQ5PUA0_9BACT|nr:50S ribosomal protein L10 [Geothrix edaphica]GLH65660.1 50S ribosomal protein L10 [Geothrix edaphica]
MEKNQKIAEVAVLKETFASATSAVVIEFKGLVVGKDTAFRKSIRESKAQYRVSKNTLLRLAVKDTTFAALGDHFKGASAVATTKDDVIALAKAVNGFLKDNPAATFKAGIMDGKQIDAKQLQVLAELPSRDVLIAKLLYLMTYPISGLAVALEGIRKQKAGE